MAFPYYFCTFANNKKEHDMAEHNELGKWGEDVAVAYLLRKGYTILERDWHSGHRDIDIIALNEERDMLVFVEVKTRRNRMFTDPIDAVNFQKIRNLRRAANHYIKYRCIDLEVRFDIISIVGQLNMEPEVEHIEDAF